MSAPATRLPLKRQPFIFPWTPHFTFLVVTHVIALYAICAHSSWQAWLLTIGLGSPISLLGITFGYHRLLTHRAFTTPKWFERLCAICGCLCMQGDPIDWIARHRQHHRFADTGADPHDATRGFFFAHMGWLGVDYVSWVTPAYIIKYAPDLVRDPFYLWLRRYHWNLAIVFIALCYAVAGVQGVLWFFFVRIVLTFQTTSLVNSAGHMMGYRAFPTDDGSTNCMWTAWVTFGEGWHNNHHAYPSSACQGLSWWQWDLTWQVIRVLAKLGLVNDIRLPPQDALERARPARGAMEVLGLSLDSYNPGAIRIPEKAVPENASQSG